MQRVLLVVITVLLVIAAYRFSLPGESGAPPAATDTPAPGDVATRIAELFQEPVPIPSPRPDATWTERTRLTGTGVSRSDPFELTGGLVRLRYVLNEEVTILALSLVRDCPQNPGVFPDVMAAQAGETERLVTRPPGTYCLLAQSAGGEWTAFVEEEVPSSPVN
jgi:hypothetical protein